MQASRRRVIGYVLFVGVVSTCLLAILGQRWWPPDPRELIFFWAILAIGDRLEVEATVRGIPQAGLRQRKPSFSAGFLVMLVCAFATDPFTTALLGMLGALVPSGWRGILRSVFNAAQTAIYGGAASACFVLLRRELGETAAASLFGAAVAASCAVLLNTFLVGGVLALERRRRLFSVVRELSWPTPNSLAFSLLALLVGLLYVNSGASAVLLLLAPLFVLRHARQGKLELDHARSGALRAFVSAVDLKSPWTSRHSANVASIAVELHRLLGARENDIEKRYYGALLHDVGKVAVSGHLLSKRGALSAEEWEEMCRHPTAGAIVLTDVEFLRDLTPEVLYHHERLNGSGYPSGLRGADIPFEARVLAVADTFEALTSNRPYRGALSREGAVEEIRRGSGALFDPIVVDALVKLVSNGFELPAMTTPSIAASETSQQEIARGA